MFSQDDFYNSFLKDAMPSKKPTSVDDETQAFIDSCNDLKGEIEDFRSSIKKKVETFLKEKAAFIFKKFPFVATITWTQYTPGFCDGDPCHFRSNHEYASINNREGSGDDENWVDEYEFEGGEPTEEQKNAAEEAVKAFLGAFDGDDMYSMFGDNVKVTISEDGIDKDDYDCGY